MADSFNHNPQPDIAMPKLIVRAQYPAVGRSAVEPGIGEHKLAPVKGNFDQYDNGPRLVEMFKRAHHMLYARLPSPRIMEWTNHVKRLPDLVAYKEQRAAPADDRTRGAAEGIAEQTAAFVHKFLFCCRCASYLW